MFIILMFLIFEQTEISLFILIFKIKLWYFPLGTIRLYLLYKTIFLNRILPER